MKQKTLILFLGILFFGNVLSYSETVTIPGIQENIAIALRTGNSKVLATYFSSTIEISLPTKEGTFSKVQSELIMKDFFSKNPPSSFVIDQKGSSSGGAMFMIGTYKSNNKIYKTYILLKPFENQMLIQQIQFETE